jgi:hypothetical protein
MHTIQPSDQRLITTIFLFKFAESNFSPFKVGVRPDLPFREKKWSSVTWCPRFRAVLSALTWVRGWRSYGFFSVGWGVTPQRIQRPECVLRNNWIFVIRESLEHRHESLIA